MRYKNTSAHIGSFSFLIPLGSKNIRAAELFSFAQTTFPYPDVVKYLFLIMPPCRRYPSVFP